MFLATSTPDVVTVPEEVTIVSGSSYVQVPVTVPFSPGVARLKALAAGYETAEIELGTVNPLGAEPPFRLSISALPPVLDPGSSGLLTVSIVDINGVPYLTPEDVRIVLTGSDSGAVEIPRVVVVPKSGHMVKVSWKALRAGKVNILAQADTFESDSAQVDLRGDVLAGDPVFMEAYSLLSSIPAAGSEQELVLLQALDEERRPVPFPCTEVFVTSSAPRVASVSSANASPCDSPVPFVTYNVRTTGTPGEANLTAGAADLGSSSVVLSTHRLQETHLELGIGPSSPLGQDVVPAHLGVQLLDEAGRPVVFHEGYEVTLIGRGIDVPESVSIPAGESFALIEMTATTGDDEVSIVATTPGVEGTSLAFEIRHRRLEIAIDIPALNAGAPARLTAEVTSEDAPVEGAQVVWEISGLLAEPVSVLTDEEGIAVLDLPATDLGGRVSVTARASRAGFEGVVSATNVTIAGSAGAEDGPSRLPFILVFAAACATLIGYVVYNSRLYRKLPRRIPANVLRRLNRSS